MLIYLDLDGTLLNNASQISKNSKEYIDLLKKNGHHVVLVTGRPYRGCIHFYEQLKLDTPLIVDNGATIIGNNHFENKTFTIPKEILNTIYMRFKDHIVSAFFTSWNTFYAIAPQERLQAFYYVKEDTKIVEGTFYNLPEEAPLLIMIIKKPFHTSFLKLIDDLKILEVRSWGEDRKNAIYEIFLKGVHKGSATEYVREKLGIHKEEVIAFGDGNNDVELLSYSHVGVAMKNGGPEVFSVADEVTAYTNNEDGVIKHLMEKIKDLK